MDTLLTYIHCTWGGVLFLLATMFVVHASSVIGRQHQPDVIRTKFDWGVWLSDWVNWLSVLVTLVSSFILLGIRESIAPIMGVTVSDPVQFELFFAVIVGLAGQVVWEALLKYVAAKTTGKAPTDGPGAGR